MHSHGETKSPVRILQSGVIIDRAGIPGLQAEYAATGIAFLPAFLSPSVLDLLLKEVAATEFSLINEVSKSTGSTFGATCRASGSDPAVIALHFLLNRSALFRMAADVTGIPLPGNFLGRLHRTEPAADQHIDWHDDAVDGRVLGLDINLSVHGFRGGLFQIRGPERRMLQEIRFSRPGDAFLFRIGERWQHRLTLVEAGIRTVAVGWFRRDPDWYSLAASAFLTGKRGFSGGKEQ